MSESRWITVLQRSLGKFGWLSLLLGIIARFGYLLYILYGIAEWFRPGSYRERQGRRHTLLYCLFSVLVGSTVSLFTGFLWRRQRPFVADRNVKAIIPHRANASFPSNHSANSLAISLQLLRTQPAAGLAFLAWSLVIGFSRVFCGIHYATDVLAGFGLGILSYIAVRRRAWAQRLAAQVCYVYDSCGAFIRTWRRL